MNNVLKFAVNLRKILIDLCAIEKKKIWGEYILRIYPLFHKVLDDKKIKVKDNMVVNMNDYQIVRLKAIRMKCKEILKMLKEF